MNTSDELLTAKEFSDTCGLSVTRIRKLLREKKIKGKKQSGKWMIPASELTSKHIEDKSVSRSDKKSSGKVSMDETADVAYCSVSEFCDLTYLTESGVIRFLQSGRLKGVKDENGQWRVDRTSLKLSGIRHLVRN